MLPVLASAESVRYLEEAVVKMEANHPAPGVYDSNLPVLHRASHPVLHIPAGPRHELPCAALMSCWAL